VIAALRGDAPAWHSHELEALRESAHRFFAAEFVPNEERWSTAGCVDREVWRQVGAMGFLCAGIPAEHGGGGGSLAHEAMIYEAAAKATTVAFGNIVHSGIVAHYILAYGTPTQQQRWLPRMASGDAVGAVAMTEPGAGSDLKAIGTHAIRDGDGYVINGSKTFITNALYADVLLLVAKTDPAAGAKGISLFLLDLAELPGFRRGRVLDKLGQKTQDTGELFFDGVRASTQDILGGTPGCGFAQLMAQLARERLLIAIEAVAMMERAIELTVAHARDRQVFGQRLLELQNTRFKLAECATRARTVRTFVDQAIGLALQERLDPVTASMAKYWASEQLGWVVDECLQLFGGYGYMTEYPIARLYANARVLRIYGGANEIMKELIARAL
jgi:acyl-CoA dehydrogenase